MKEGWNSGTFADIFDLQMGKTPSRDNPSFWGGDNIWVSIADMNCGKFIYDTKEHISDLAVSQSGIHLVKKNTVIMSFKLSIGKTAIATKDLYTNEAIMSFNIKDGFNILPTYIYYYLKGYKWQGMNKAVMGMTLNKKTISNNIFSYPTIPLQQHIVEELDLLSSIIEKKKTQLNELDNLAQSLFYEMFGDLNFNTNKYLIKKLGEVCSIERGGSPRPITDYITDAENGINWIKIGDAVEGSKYIMTTAERIKPEGMKKSRFVHKGDFILSNSMSFGKPYILGVDGCIHDGWLVIHDDNDVFDKSYLYYYLSSPTLYGEFKRLAVGGVVNNLNSKLVRGVKVAIPPLELQKLFAQKERAIENQKELIKQSIKEVETLFNSRMDYYFN